MKRRIFAPVEPGQQPVTSKGDKLNPLAVPMPLPAYENTPRSVRSTEPAAGAGDPVRSTELPESTATVVRSTELTQTAVEPDATRYIAEIDTRLIDPNKNPPRQLYSDDRIRDLSESIRDGGQRDPIHVILNPDKPGRYIIGDGWTRVQAIRAYNVNQGKVMAWVYKDLDEEQISWLGFKQNEERTSATDFDRAAYYQTWHEAGMSWEEIAQRCGVSKVTMSGFTAYSKLGHQIQDIAKRHPEKLTAAAASILIRLQNQVGEDAAAAIANRFVSEERTHKWLKDRVDNRIKKYEKYEQTGEKRKDSIIFSRKFGEGFYKQRANGKVELSISIKEERVDEFNSALQDLLDKFLTESASEDQGAAASTPEED